MPHAARRPALVLAALVFAALAAAAALSTRRAPPPPTVRPSPLLDAAGLAPPDLARWRCHPRRTAWGWSRRRAVELLLGPGEMTCLRPRAGEPETRALGGRELTSVMVDRTGWVYGVARDRAGLRLATAAAAAESTLAAGRRLPGARPLECPAAPRIAGGPAVVRGWATADYEALVDVQHRWPASAAGYAVQLEVSRGRFAICE
jgi:hypothetical protein